MIALRKFLFSATVGPLVAAVVGCGGADEPKIVQVPAAEVKPADPEEAKSNLPKNKYMDNPKYKQMMDKMEKSQR